MSTSTVLASPTFTATSTASSFDLVSPRSRSSSTYSSRSSQPFSDDSDDEIVWSVASSGILSASELLTESILSESEDDFVLLEHSRNSRRSARSLSTPNPHVSASSASADDDDISLVFDIEELSISATPTQRTTQPKKQAKKRAVTPLASAVTPKPSLVVTKPASPAPRKRKRVRKSKSPIPSGFGSRPIVDDISEGVSEPLNEVATSSSVYDEAVRYINSFLTNPNDSHCHLTLLQALIVELGLATSSLPSSMRAAKAYLKSRAFVNIRDYLALRGQGPDALQSVMYPSRSALIKDIRRKRNQASLKWVKQNGLQVLLVSCFR